MTLAAVLLTDPVPALLAADDAALVYFARRDFLGEDPGPVDLLWDLPPARRLLAKQQGDGAWRYPGQNRQRFPETNYDLLETFRTLGTLVDQYGLDHRHPALTAAAEYLFSCQTADGDLRGILGTQYMPYYHATVLELLVKAGYADDPRLIRGLEWLLTMRQDDGGWIVPAQALPARDKTRGLWTALPVHPDRARPFSHLATGMVLRAFAAHPAYCRHADAVAAAEGLKRRFFRPDRYNDRKAPLYWTRFQYPFWWTNLLTALDSLWRLGFDRHDPDIRQGLDWFVVHQQRGDSPTVLRGLWATGYERGHRGEQPARQRAAQQWVGLAVCRVLQAFYG